MCLTAVAFGVAHIDELTQTVFLCQRGQVFVFVAVRGSISHRFCHQRTNAQTLIGEEAVVLEPINNLRSQGRVMIHGQEWAARSVDEKETFEKNAVVLVQSISGVKLMVTRSVGQ